METYREPAPYDEIDLRRYAQILWHRAWLIALCAVLAAEGHLRAAGVLDE